MYIYAYTVGRSVLQAQHTLCNSKNAYDADIRGGPGSPENHSPVHTRNVEALIGISHANMKDLDQDAGWKYAGVALLVAVVIATLIADWTGLVDTFTNSFAN